MTEASFSVRVQQLHALSETERHTLLARSETDIAGLIDYVRPLIEDVRTRGDAAVRELTARFDKVDLGDMPLRVQPEEFEAAESKLPAEVLKAIDHAIDNLTRAHRDQLGETVIKTQVAPGVVVGERTLPLPAVGLYVPRGKGSFPSVVMMLAIPAVVAGVKRPVIITPPGPGGEVDAATLAVAHRVGVKEVYRIGGVQGIAAIAYGTEEMPRLPKVLGPGNSYVTAAKRALMGVLDPGVPAGPSESVILADDTIAPMIAAHDLLIEAEHGPDSCAVLVTDSQKLADAVADALPDLVAALPEERQRFITENFRGRSCILVAESHQAAIDFVNDFAPEHLEVLTKDPHADLELIENAGEVMLGQHAPITVGNFCAGTNAILPTGGLARSASCLGVPDFQKRSSYVDMTEEGFQALAETAVTMADYEGFPAHAQAVRYRLGQ